MTDRTIIFEPTALKRKVELFNHLLPALLLLAGGYEALTGQTHERMLSPWLNIAVGILLLLVVIYEFRIQHDKQPRLVNWIDIIAGIVLTTEGVNIYHANKWFQPAYGYLLIGVFTIGKGIFHTKFPRGRKLVLREDGFSARLSPFIRLHLRWKHISSITIERTSIQFLTEHLRTRTLNLRRVENKSEVISAFLESAQSLGISVTDHTT